MAKADIFLKLDGSRTGSVKGESNDPAHAGEIEITDWGWGMTGSRGLGGAGTDMNARTALSEIRISKGADTATTSLMSVMRNNELVKQAVMTVRKAGTSGPVDYLVITIKNGRITSYNIGSRAPDDPVLVETFTMAFEEIEVKYTGQSGRGEKAASSVFTANVAR
jgi:type VI secretion system secreted protein Hcp